jgi:hypothetical protein
MKLKAILLCDSPQQRHWELPLPDTTAVTLTLLGWIVRPEPVDSGVPVVVAEVLSRALSDLGMVSYFGAPVRAGLLRGLFTRSAEATLCHASDPQAVGRVFEDATFDWSARAQAAFISRTDAPPPSLTLQDLEQALAGQSYERLRACGVTALLLPGVDGDVAGFYAFERELAQRVREVLQAAAAQHGAAFRQLSEAAFARDLAEH